LIKSKREAIGVLWIKSIKEKSRQLQGELIYRYKIKLTTLPINWLQALICDSYTRIFPILASGKIAVNLLIHSTSGI
jgi:hypothetical protein